MVAAWCVGVADLEQLCKVVHARANGQHLKMPEGGAAPLTSVLCLLISLAMAAFGVSEEDANRCLESLKIEDIDIAAINTDDNVTLSGTYFILP